MQSAHNNRYDKTHVIPFEIDFNRILLDSAWFWVVA